MLSWPDSYPRTTKAAKATNRFIQRSIYKGVLPIRGFLFHVVHSVFIMHSERKVVWLLSGAYMLLWCNAMGWAVQLSNWQGFFFFLSAQLNRDGIQWLFVCCCNHPFSRSAYGIAISLDYTNGVCEGVGYRLSVHNLEKKI